MFDTRVLGIDPGLARLGLAVVARRGRARQLVWTDVARTPAGMDESRRLMILVEAVRRAIAEHRPDAVAVERVAFNRNVVSAMAVARITGALMVTAAEAGLPIEEYSPTEVKNSVTGVGNADKRQVRDALVRVHGLTSVPLQADATDAVAVAVTHLAGARLRAAARTGTR
ncbi:MAG: crossover junction endodeoxyribonuclease RuvC [Actinomycetota bacterium]|nr:crossover junction endodeoxyribonuclease RuvC [Actinomycetota bacterium]